MTALSILDRKAMRAFEVRMHQLTNKPFVDEDYAVVTIRRGPVVEHPDRTVSITMNISAEKGTDMVESYTEFLKENGIWTATSDPKYRIINDKGERMRYQFYASNLPGHDLLAVNTCSGNEYHYKVTSTNRCDTISEDSFRSWVESR